MTDTVHWIDDTLRLPLETLGCGVVMQAYSLWPTNRTVSYAVQGLKGSKGFLYMHLSPCVAKLSCLYFRLSDDSCSHHFAETYTAQALM